MRSELPSQAPEEIVTREEAEAQVAAGTFDTGSVDLFITENIFQEGVIGIIRRRDGSTETIPSIPTEDVEVDDYLKIQRRREELGAISEWSKILLAPNPEIDDDDGEID